MSAVVYGAVAALFLIGSVVAFVSGSWLLSLLGVAGFSVTLFAADHAEKSERLGPNHRARRLS